MVTSGQSRVLRVCEVGCSVVLSAAICPIPKLTVASSIPAILQGIYAEARAKH
jgi:hypothetical protein